MRLFGALNVNGNKKMLDALEDTGFISVLPKEFDFDDRFFCLVSSSKKDNDLIWIKHRPRIVFTYDKNGVNSHLYTWQEIVLKDKSIFLGTLSEIDLVLAKDWYLDYSTTADDEITYLKYIADVSYKYILAELIDETAQWCGHMSSVVHKL